MDCPAPSPAPMRVVKEKDLTVGDLPPEEQERVLQDFAARGGHVAIGNASSPSSQASYAGSGIEEYSMWQEKIAEAVCKAKEEERERIRGIVEAFEDDTCSHVCTHKGGCGTSDGDALLKNILSALTEDKGDKPSND